jgi:hypothetical protein
VATGIPSSSSPAADRHSIAPLKDFCDQLGYAAYDWGRGFNTGPQGDLDAWLDDLARHVLEVTGAHEEPVSLIGWSLGGIYAREVAKKLTGRVRQVITIGTPFAGSAEQTHASCVYRLLSGQEPTLPPLLMARLRTAPDAPTTSIFSRSDGVVAWQACIQDGGANHTENIEVDGSHCGLGWNPEVLCVIADRLRQPMGAWQRMLTLTEHEARAKPSACAVNGGSADCSALPVPGMVPGAATRCV